MAFSTHNPADGRRKCAAALWAAAAGGVLASACCVGPLVLLMLGVSGAWIGNLAALAPLQPIFLAMAVIALFAAGRQIWRPRDACAVGEICALQRVRWGYRLAFVGVSLLVLLGALFPLVAHWFY